MRNKRKGPSIKRILILLAATAVLIFVIYHALMASLNALFNSFSPEQPSAVWESELFVNRDGFKAYNDENVVTKIGIDVSDHQKEIDWKQVKNSGIDFAVIRVGYRGAVEGILHEDKYGRQNLKEATDNGIPVGVYFFSSAVNEQEIEEEIDFIMDKIKGVSLSYPVVFDMEPYEGGGRIDALTKEEKTNLAIAFCERVKEKGYTPMIYGNKHWFTQEVDLEQLEEYPLWYAAYQDQPAATFPYSIWQYSSTATIPGIETDVDMNIYLHRK